MVRLKVDEEEKSAGAILNRLLVVVTQRIVLIVYIKYSNKWKESIPWNKIIKVGNNIRKLMFLVYNS